MITKTRQDTTLLLTYFSGVCLTKKVAWLGGYFMCPTTFHVTEVFTEPDWRNQGIATALFKRLFYELKKNKIQHTILCIPRTIATQRNVVECDGCMRGGAGRVNGGLKRCPVVCVWCPCVGRRVAAVLWV